MLQKCCMWGWRFRDWIIYGENDRHAACVPNVSATGRSPVQTAKSVPLVQLWVMGNGADSRARSFSPSWTSGSVVWKQEEFKTSDKQLKEFETVLTWTLPPSHAWGVSVVYKVLVLRLSCVFVPFHSVPKQEGMSESHCGQPLRQSTPTHRD